MSPSFIPLYFTTSYTLNCRTADYFCDRQLVVLPGSILSSLLYNFYLWKFPSAPPVIEVIYFSDEFNAIEEGNNVDSLYGLVNGYLNVINMLIWYSKECSCCLIIPPSIIRGELRNYVQDLLDRNTYMNNIHKDAVTNYSMNYVFGGHSLQKMRKICRDQQEWFWLNKVRGGATG